jgi:hypothetical protein
LLYDDGERLTIAEQRGYGLEFNDEREFVDNYMVIRVQQKSKKKIKKFWSWMEEARNSPKCISPFLPATVRQCIITL